MIRLLILCLLLGIQSLVFFGCAYNEATGTRQFNFISDEEEINVGREADKVIRGQYGVYPDEVLQNYVNGVGQRVATFSGRSDIEYYFTVLDSPIINAFALPGGWVYVTRGALSQLNSEAELAFVLGHEVSHISARHGAQRLSQAKSIQTAFALAQAVFQDGVEDWGRLAAEGVNLAVLGYGRKNEFEADQFGVDYAYAAQYHPDEFDDFFVTLKRQQQYESDWLKQLQSSHPDTSERIKRVKDRIWAVHGVEPVDDAVFDTGRETFLRAIEGMFIGSSPSYGAFKGRTYLNLPYGLTFELPRDWDVAVPSDNSGVLKFRHKFLPVEGRLIIERFSDALTFEEWTAKFFQDYDKVAKKLEHRQVKYYRRDALLTRYARIVRDGEMMRETAGYFVNGNTGYRFVFYHDQMKSVASSQREIEVIFKSVDYLSRERVREMGEGWLDIYEVRVGDTLASVAANFGVSEDQILAFNGLESSVLEAGDLLKIPLGN